VPENVNLTELFQPGVLGVVFGAMAVFAAGVVVDILLLIRLVRRPAGWFPHFKAIRSRPWTWFEALSILAVLFAFREALASYGGPPPDLATASTATLMQPLLLSTLGFHGVGFLLVVLYILPYDSGWQTAFGSSLANLPRSVLRGIVGYFAVMPLVMAGMVITALICTLTGYRPEPQIVVQILQRTDSALLILYLGIVAVTAAPIVEELLFRGVGLSFLGKHMHPVAATLCTSAFFAVVHMHLPSLAPIFLLAMGLSLAYLYTGDIVVPVTMHAVFNAMSLVAALLVKDAMPFQ
jgi:membrane protease YdiL (CAAX protease family)